MSRLHDPKLHDDLLNYQLKHLVAIGGAPAIRLCEGGYGVTRQEWRVIAALVEEGPMSPSALCHRCRPFGPAGTSRIVSSLSAKDLVHRSPLPGDGRRAVIEATAAGHRLYADLFPQLAAINRRIMSVLDEDEALLLGNFLSRLTARAEEIRDTGDGVDVRANRLLGGSRRLWS